MSGRGAVRDAAWVVGYFVVAGLVAGVLWWHIVDPPYFVRTAQGALMDQAQLSRRVQADGWFLTIGVVAGLLGGVALTWWRSRDPLFTLLLGVAASLLGAWIAWRLGTMLGHSDVTTLVRRARVGEHVPDSLAVISKMVLIAWPAGFLVGAVAVLFTSHDSDADVEDPEPAEVQHQD